MSEEDDTWERAGDDDATVIPKALVSDGLVRYDRSGMFKKHFEIGKKRAEENLRRWLAKEGCGCCGMGRS